MSAVPNKNTEYLIKRVDLFSRIKVKPYRLRHPTSQRIFGRAEEARGGLNLR
jgi:hypothetical protein